MLEETITKFLRRANTNELKKVDLRDEFANLDSLINENFLVDLSFGQGTKSKIPWISILDRETNQVTSNGIYPVYLYYREINKLILAYGISETNQPEMSWQADVYDNQDIRNYLIENSFEKKFYPTDKRTYKDSYIFVIYDIYIRENDSIEIFQNEQKVNHTKLEKDLSDILNQYNQTLGRKSDDVSKFVSDQEFKLEQHLEDFLIENWDSTILGEKYQLIYDEGHLLSKQYPAHGIGTIDILAKHKDIDQFIVIELKKGQSEDRTVAQIQRYMTWVDKNRAAEVRCHGIIIAHRASDKLTYALEPVKERIDLLLYKINFDLTKKETKLF